MAEFPCEANFLKFAKFLFFLGFLVALYYSIVSFTSKSTGIQITYKNETAQIPTLSVCPMGYRNQDMKQQLSIADFNLTYFLDFMGHPNNPDSDWLEVYLQGFDGEGRAIVNLANSSDVMMYWNISLQEIWGITAKISTFGGQNRHWIKCYVVQVPEKHYTHTTRVQISLNQGRHVAQEYVVEFSEPNQSKSVVKTSWSTLVYRRVRSDRHGYTGINLSMAKEKRLSTSQDPCDETNSVKQTKCFYEYIFDILQCNLPWRLPVNKDARICSMKEDFDKYRDELMNLAFVRRDFPPKCSLTKCEILTWNQRVFYNEFDFFDPNNETFKITHPSKLRMFSFDDEVQVIQEYEVYTMTNFIADFGGYLGLLLGASLPSILENLLRFAHYIYAFWKRPKKM